MSVRWKRHRDGEASGAAYADVMTIWTATINGTHVVIANMQGQSVRYTGLGAHVLVWTNVKPDSPFDQDRQVHSDFTVRDAKAWAVKEYS